MAKKLSPFEEAFKEARADGRKTFTFNGKSYGTVTADEEQKRIDKKFSPTPAAAPTGIQAGTRYVTPPHTPTPSHAKARSLVDQGRDVNIYNDDVDRDAVLQAGLGMASLYPGTIAARTAYGVARPAIGAAARYFSKKDNPAASVADDAKDPSFGKFFDDVPRSQSESKFNPEKMTGRDQPETAFNLERMVGRERPEPMKKGGMVKKMASGGKVSASSRADGIAQRGKTKGRMC